MLGACSRFGAFNLLLLAVTLPGLAACGLGEKEFLKKFYKERCELEFDCWLEDASATWGDDKSCREAFQTSVDEGKDYFEGCRFKQKEARACLKELRQAECGEREVVLADLDLECDESVLWECE